MVLHIEKNSLIILNLIFDMRGRYATLVAIRETVLEQRCVKNPGGVVKFKSLAIIMLLVVGCSAAFAQTYSFGFLSASGVNEYCNYESFLTGGRDNFYLQGYDVLSACPYSPIAGASINGFAITVPIAAFAPVNGKAYVYADQIYDAYAGAYTGEQWVVITKTAPGKIQYGKETWAGYLGYFGYEFLGNYGFLTTTIPGAAASHSTLKTTTINTKTLKNLIASHHAQK
jgi:hypothetical protein